MFELEAPTKAKQTDLEVLSQKNRPPDSNPGVVLSFMAERPNSALTELDGRLRSMLYCKNASSEASPQKNLDGVEPVSDLPNLTPIGEHMGRFHWAYKQTGCTLTYDYGAGGASNIVLRDVVVESLQVTCKEGGTTTWQWKCEVADVDVQIFGKLATFKNREVSLLLAGPDVSQRDLTEDDVFPNRPTNEEPAQDEGGTVRWPFPNAAPGSPADVANKKASKGGKGKKDELTPEKALAAAVEGGAA
jgi:hypothetical protein